MSLSFLCGLIPPSVSRCPLTPDFFCVLASWFLGASATGPYQIGMPLWLLLLTTLSIVQGFLCSFTVPWNEAQPSPAAVLQGQKVLIVHRVITRGRMHTRG